MYLDMQVQSCSCCAARRPCRLCGSTRRGSARLQLPAPRRPTVLHPPPHPPQATTPMDPRVVDAMLPFMTEQYGNPHSRTHLYGWEAEEAVEAARGQVRRRAVAQAAGSGSL